jgi:MFS family permease
MNATNLSPLSGATPALPLSANLDEGPPVRLPRLLLGLALAVAIFDLCFWDVDAMGFSVAVFFLALAGIIMGNRESRGGKYTILLVALLVGASIAAAIETGVTNSLVLLILIVVLAGETFFGEIESPWGRWLSQGVALIFAPGRVFWLGARLMEAAFKGGAGWTGGLLGGCLLAIPALVLALIFGSLLATGNAVFGSWTNSFFDWFWKELALYLNPARIALWFLIAFLILPLLRPAHVSAWWWKWTETLPRLPEILPTRATVFSSGLVLVVLNLLFLVANIADALFLWSGQALPADVTYKAYVHEGVSALIVTVILSAIVLTAIFQQAVKVVERRELKILAYVWIVQNLFLIFSVTEKLRRYIVTYEMTVARLSTIIFLVLVLVGFILLTIKIARDRSISWLIGGCVLAVFATFYLTQFMDLAGWSANYNVAAMERNQGYRFDCKTMCQWGADVWPALRRAHELAPDDPDINAAWQEARTGSDYSERSGHDWRHWREFSLRAWMNRGALDDKK